jgi:hypothetical protein
LQKHHLAIIILIGGFANHQIIIFWIANIPASHQNYT